METEMIDKLFLELSQVTKAKTAKEISLEQSLLLAESKIRYWQQYASYLRSCALSGEHNPETFLDFCERMNYSL